MSKSYTEHTIGWKLLFWCYLIVIFLFVVVKFDGNISNLISRMQSYQAIRSTESGYNINMVPFRTIQSQVQHLPETWAIRNLAANVLFFVPFGWLLPRSHPKLRYMFPVCLIALIGIIAIEIFQYITLIGSCDVDDLILNMAGVVLGYLLFLPAKFRLRRKYGRR